MTSTPQYRPPEDLWTRRFEQQTDSHDYLAAARTAFEATIVVPDYLAPNNTQTEWVRNVTSSLELHVAQTPFGQREEATTVARLHARRMARTLITEPHGTGVWHEDLTIQAFNLARELRSYRIDQRAVAAEAAPRAEEAVFEATRPHGSSWKALKLAGRGMVGLLLDRAMINAPSPEVVQQRRENSARFRSALAIAASRPLRKIETVETQRRAAALRLLNS